VIVHHKEKLGSEHAVNVILGDFVGEDVQKLQGGSDAEALLEDLKVKKTEKKLLGSKSTKTGSSQLSAPKLGLDCGWSCIPHPLKVHRGGEDVHFVHRIKGVTLLGVCDGVGGWAEVGIDPAEYARKLGNLLEANLRADPSIVEKSERPLYELLHKAHVALEEENLAGSCTACLALLTRDGKVGRDEGGGGELTLVS